MALHDWNTLKSTNDLMNLIFVLWIHHDTFILEAYNVALSIFIIWQLLLKYALLACYVLHAFALFMSNGFTLFHFHGTVRLLGHLRFGFVTSIHWDVSFTFTKSARILSPDDMVTIHRHISQLLRSPNISILWHKDCMGL